ncbi:MAG: YqgE/AlgH family protein [Pseudomonadota bacterium]
MDDQDFLTGQVLIATPNMGDPRFDRAVVLMCAHESTHAMGLIVNKRLDKADFGDVLEQLDLVDDAADAPGPVFFGGPVRRDRGLVVHTRDYESEQTLAVTPTVGVTGTKDILAAIASGAASAPKRYLLAMGHAGWGDGQLEQEIAMNAWAHGPATDDLIFNGGEEDAWSRALEAIGVTAAMFSPEWSSPRDLDTPLN